MPSYLKRKHEDEDGDEEFEPSQRQILPVANLPANFDGEPMDGLQYLWTVRRDAKKLPNVTRVPNPYERADPTPLPHSLPPDGSGKSSTPVDPRLPSEEWRRIFERRFVNFRKNMSQPTITVALPSDRSGKLMPDKKDRDAWWSFLSGAPSSVWDPPRKPKVNKYNRRNQPWNNGLNGYGVSFSEYSIPYDEAKEAGDDAKAEPKEEGEVGEPVQMRIGVVVDGMITGGDVAVASAKPPPPIPLQQDVLQKLAASAGSTTPDGPSTWVPREPIPTILQKVDHRMSLHLLMYFTYWLNLYIQAPTPTSPHVPLNAHARWIFALLSRVDDFCGGEEVSGLRALARACLSLIHLRRKQEASKDESGESVDKENVSDGKESRMSETSCWMIICAVVGVWGQRDLWMDAEEQLSRSA